MAVIKSLQLFKWWEANTTVSGLCKVEKLRLRCVVIGNESNPIAIIKFIKENIPSSV